MVTKRRNYTKRRKPKTNRRNTRRHTKRRNVKRKNTKKRKISKKSNKILIQEGGMLGCSRRPSKRKSRAKPVTIRVQERNPMIPSAGADATAAPAAAASARTPDMTGSNRKELEKLAKELGIDAKDYANDSELELILKILSEDYYFSEEYPIPKRSLPHPLC